MIISLQDKPLLGSSKVAVFGSIAGSYSVITLGKIVFSSNEGYQT